MCLLYENRQIDTLKVLIYSYSIFKVQQALYDEQCRIFGEHSHHDNVEQHHLADMKYLECCIKESLRLYPSVPVIGRTADATKDIDGYTLNKGETVVVLVWYLHRNPLVWDNPDEFIPERFLDGGYVYTDPNNPN